MLLNEKSKRILHIMIHEVEVHHQFLQTILPYSKRTLEYEIDRIQEWLIYHQFPPIQISGSNLKLSSTQGVLERLEQTEMILSEEERELLIIFYTMVEKEFLSAVHYQQLLEVSKFTVQESLNAVRKDAAKFGVTLNYSRKEGYHFYGHMQTIYLYLYRAIERLVKLSTKNNLMNTILDEWFEELKSARKQIEEYESYQQIRFVEEHREKLAYFLMIGRKLTMKEVLPDSEPLFKKEVDPILHAYFDEDTDDVFVDTLDLLIQSGPKVEEEIRQDIHAHLSSVMREVIHYFETISCTFIIEKEALCEKLVLHSKATIQRLYSGLESSSELKRYVTQEHQVLNVLVSRALEPFRKWMNQPIPDIEVMYYTLHFATHLNQQGEHLDQKLKAIVVCPSGISVSHILDYILKNQFPEIIFLPPISQSEVENYSELVDLIFTTVPLDPVVHQRTDVMLVPTLPTRLEQITLKRTVEQRYLSHKQDPTVQVEDLIALIKQHATIQSETVLRQQLGNLLFPKQEKPLQGGQPVLNELITENKIQLQQGIESWEAAIELAAKPLLEDGSIKNTYIETMIRNVEEHGPYIVLMPDVAIPHARPEDGVIELGMSVLKLEKAVEFPKEKEVRLFFVLAAIDQTTHLKALSQLTNLLGNSTDVSRLLDATSVEEILTIIATYSEEE